MPYLPDLNSYLHHSSLLLQAYPTTRISTKYSLPSKKARSQPQSQSLTTAHDAPEPSSSEKRLPAATLTLKTFHANSGICLKYRTDKAAEVGRLVTGLGRLAKGEVIQLPAAVTASTGAEKVEGDGGHGAEETPEPVTVPATMPANAEEPKVKAQVQTVPSAGGGGKGKKKNRGKK